VEKQDNDKRKRKEKYGVKEEKERGGGVIRMESMNPRRHVGVREKNGERFNGGENSQD